MFSRAVSISAQTIAAALTPPFQPMKSVFSASGPSITFSGRVLRRRWLIDNRRVHQRALAQRDAIVGKMPVHLDKDRLGQPWSLLKMAKVKDRGLVGDTVVPQLDPGKSA